MKRSLSLACLLLLGLASFAQAEQGNPKLKSIEAIAFGPKGLLLIGGGAQVVAVDTGDTKETTWSKTEIANVDQLLAGKVGLTAKDIEIRKIAVNPASKKVYVALTSLKTKSDLILTIDGTGTVAEFPLENVKYTSYALTVPKTAITKVTDIIYAGGKIVAATQASDKFAGSRVFTINPEAKDGSPTQVSTKTWHVGHGQWETSAPIRCLMPYEESGKLNVVGSFTCTPLVKYPLDDAKTDTQVTGASVLELGQYSTPRSMFTYEKDGKKFILVNANRNDKKPSQNLSFPSGYWAARVDADILKETTNINEKAIWRVKGKESGKILTDRVTVAPEYFGVYYMAKLDASRAIVIRAEKGGFTLRALPLP